MTEFLKLSHIQKTFPADRGRPPVTAVQEVNLSIHSGDSLGIIGPSGCGKTTLTRIILGLLKPDAGTVSLSVKIGFVPQDPYASLDPAMTAGQIVGEPLRFSGAAKSWKDCRDGAAFAMKLVNLDYKTYENRLPSALSGGERQRIAIARALVLHPQLLILDEPTSMLDEATKQEITTLLRHLSDAHNRAFLMVTHDIAMCSQICKNLVVMEKGKIIEAGTSQQILTQPKTDLARNLILAATDLRTYWEKNSC